MTLFQNLFAWEKWVYTDKYEGGYILPNLSFWQSLTFIVCDD